MRTIAFFPIVFVLAACTANVEPPSAASEPEAPPAAEEVAPTRFVLDLGGGAGCDCAAGERACKSRCDTSDSKCQSDCSADRVICDSKCQINGGGGLRVLR